MNDMKPMPRLDRPCWLDMPRGVRLRIMPPDGCAMREVLAVAGRGLAAARDADPDMDTDTLEATRFVLLVKALAHMIVVAWEGVGDATGKPLRLSPQALERLMDIDDIAVAFWKKATAPTMEEIRNG